MAMSCPPGFRIRRTSPAVRASCSRARCSNRLLRDHRVDAAIGYRQRDIARLYHRLHCRSRVPGEIGIEIHGDSPTRLDLIDAVAISGSEFNDDTRGAEKLPPRQVAHDLGPDNVALLVVGKSRFVVTSKCCHPIRALPCTCYPVSWPGKPRRCATSRSPYPLHRQWPDPTPPTAGEPTSAR